MNSEYAKEWLNNLKEFWFNKDIEKAVSLFSKTTFYQETPFMKPYTTIEEINEELALCHNRLDELNEYNSKLALFN